MNPEDINNMRVLSLASSVLVPLIEERRQQSYEKLLASFRQGETAPIALVAEVNAYQSIIDDINFKLQSYEDIPNKENS